MVFLDGDNLQIKAYKLDGDKVLGEKQCKYDYIVDEVRKFYFKPNATTDINDIVKDNNDNTVSTTLNVYEVNLDDNNSYFNIKSSSAIWIYKLEVTYAN